MVADADRRRRQFWLDAGAFDATDIANAEMDKCIRANAERVRAEPDSSALSFMVNAKNPIRESQ